MRSLFFFCFFLVFRISVKKLVNFWGDFSQGSILAVSCGSVCLGSAWYFVACVFARQNSKFRVDYDQGTITYYISVSVAVAVPECE